MLNIFANIFATRSNSDQLLSISISWPAIFLAVVAAMAIGSIWYGPLFGKKWMKLVGLKKGESSPTVPMLIMLGLAIVQVFVLAHFITYTSYFYPNYSDLSAGLMTGLWAFIGFVMPVLVSNAVFGKGSMELLKINLGNQLITLLTVGAILGTVH